MQIDYISNSRPLAAEELATSDAFFVKAKGTSLQELHFAVEARVNSTLISVWRGDITTLSCGAIVNAANAGGLGCFQKGHKCIDNIIHSVAGPRLREACRAQLQNRDLAVGTLPIVTPGFFLPCEHVVHVTGPQLPPRSARPTEIEEQQLSFAYSSVLDCCNARGFKSVVFCCLSTGVFGYPPFLAAEVALETVRSWLQRHPDTSLERVVFDTFLESDLKIYEGLFPRFFVPASNLAFARSLLHREKSPILIVAGAGMSVYPALPESGNHNVYVDKGAFARHYPDMPATGFTTAYECMGLFGSDLPMERKWGFLARHMQNMRVNFPPCEGYNLLLQLVRDRDYFVLSSNVDGCFERAGFLKDRIYTPQGDYGRYQCRTPCSADVVWPAAPLLQNLQVVDGLLVSKVPKCPKCGGDVGGNVRGGKWFLATPYQEEQARFRKWLELHKNSNVVVIEIGAGFNTPIVTRWPAEAVARNQGSLIRINPDHSFVPKDLNHRAVSLSGGWELLRFLLEPQEKDDQAKPNNLLPNDEQRLCMKVDVFSVLDQLK